ncbi:hypothetical protein [Halorhabdus rudnickae]|uniref:hypothetical protein n=1 Tax=Halorhabdus rudnickae TaxID=1775544 RepID=UPI0014383EB1|nr:hypothetical protein [Halorhabdus rudnickae]
MSFDQAATAVFEGIEGDGPGLAGSLVERLVRESACKSGAEMATRTGTNHHS